ncbi:MAG TPA: hypothetical protein VFP20_07645 [Bacteroidales bacterium]|nr:hypothetical protein [Bacteroidales bacterium]
MAIFYNSEKQVSEEVAAAIGLALFHLNQEVHDVENTILTFGKASRTYSPWSSKIYGIRQLPNRR